jgi:hypothetical protein
MTMVWNELTRAERQPVILFLRLEAERREVEAERLRDMARRLDRPSLMEESEQGATAFWAAIQLLESDL